MRPAPPLIDRLPEQYFTRILAAAAAARERPGPRFIDLGRGNPDLPPPEAATEALAAERYHGYPPFGGTPALKEAIAHRYATDHGVALDPETEIAVVPGTKTAIMLVALATAGDGDTVLLPDPGYPDYTSGVAMAGARAAALPLEASAAFQPDFDAVEHGGAALALLNYPSNPCAVCERDGTFEAAVAWAHYHGAWLMHDLAYGFLAFDGHRGRSILEIDGAREVSVELWSPSKIYGMAGWRVGFVAGAQPVVARVKTLVDHLTAGVWTGIQAGLTAALTGDQSSVAHKRAVYEARRDRLAARIDGLRPPEGTFYAWWRLPAGLTAQRILEEARVAVAPGEGFGSRGAGWARLSLAVPDADVDEAADRIAALL
jgi:aminotransferase